MPVLHPCTTYGKHQHPDVRVITDRKGQTSTAGPKAKGNICD